MAVNDSCSVPGDECTPGGRLKLGMCSKHYQRYKKHGGTSADVLPSYPRSSRGEAMAFIELAVAYAGENCLLWPYGTSGQSGYGLVHVGDTTTTAHRLVLELTQGPPPHPDMEAAHAPVICRQRLCVNPSHLRWATGSENNMDKVPDDTHRRGERCPAAKLNRYQVWAIRVDPRPYAAIALEYGISVPTVSNIKTRRSWAWLPDSEDEAA